MGQLVSPRVISESPRALCCHITAMCGWLVLSAKPQSEHGNYEVKLCMLFPNLDGFILTLEYALVRGVYS